MKAFDKIIGYESVKNELYQIIDMFKNKELYEKMGAKLPKGILIYGDPGLGKTMLANALIEESNLKSFILRKNKDNKETLDEIRTVFSEAEKEDMAIVLIDDIDKFCEDDDEDVDDEIFVAIQAGIDSLKRGNVLVVATANSYRKLPASLRRSGRFDRKIELKSPTHEDARKIIEYYMKTKRVDADLDYNDVAKMISYSSCADLENILNESAIYAAYQRKENIDIDDIVKSYLRSQCGVPDEFHKSAKEEIAATVIHEAGHAIVAEVLKAGSVGFICVQTPGRSRTDGFIHLCEELKRRPEQVLVALGGKAAVELFYEGRCASGCQSDIEKAYSLIRGGITESGTCGVGMINVSTSFSPSVSESLNSRNEAVVHAEFERLLFIARDILLKNKDFLIKLTEKLKDKPVLLYSDIQNIRSTVKITEVTI